MIFKLKRKYFSEENKPTFKEKVQNFKENPREGIRKVGHKAVDAVVDNPIDTAAYVAGDLVLPGMLAKKAVKKWTGPKGKAAAAALGVYAMSPIGLTSAAIATKNKIKKKKAAKKSQQD